MRLEFDYTPDDLSAFLGLAALRRTKRARKFGQGPVGWALFVLISAALLAWLEGSSRPRWNWSRLPALPLGFWLANLVMAFVFAVWCIAHRRLENARFKRVFKASKEWQLHYVMELGPEGIALSSPSGKTDWRWDRFVEVSFSTQVFVLWQPEGSGIVIPVRAASNEKQLGEVINLLATCVQKPTGGFPVLVRPAA